MSPISEVCFIELLVNESSEKETMNYENDNFFARRLLQEYHNYMYFITA